MRLMKLRINRINVPCFVLTRLRRSSKVRIEWRARWSECVNASPKRILSEVIGGHMLEISWGDELSDEKAAFSIYSTLFEFFKVIGRFLDYQVIRNRQYWRRENHHSVSPSDTGNKLAVSDWVDLAVFKRFLRIDFRETFKRNALVDAVHAFIDGVFLAMHLLALALLVSPLTIHSGVMVSNNCSSLGRRDRVEKRETAEETTKGERRHYGSLKAWNGWVTLPSVSWSTSLLSLENEVHQSIKPSRYFGESTHS